MAFRQLAPTEQEMACCPMWAAAHPKGLLLREVGPTGPGTFSLSYWGKKALKITDLDTYLP